MHLTPGETRPVARAARAGLAEWLQTLPWTHFCTFTFKQPTANPYSALKRVARITPTSWGVERAVHAAEPHASGDYHVHSMLFVPRAVETAYSSGRAWDNAAWLHGFSELGRCKVERVHSLAHVAGYCSKYLVKDACDYSLAGGVRWWRA